MLHSNHPTTMICNDLLSSSSTVHGTAASSTSRMLTAYEISDELQRRRVEVLERRYGGRERAHTAASLIQRTFREWSLNRRFREMMMSTHGGLSARSSSTAYPMKSYGQLPIQRPFVVSPLQRITPPVPMEFSRTRAISTGRVNAIASPTRYTPSTSLLAQLRRETPTTPPSTLLDDSMRPRAGTRSPPSPAPPSRQNRSGSSSHTIESLMSPRLVARRLIGCPPSSMHTPDMPSGPSPVVWVPRTSVPYNGGYANGHTSRSERPGRALHQQQPPPPTPTGTGGLHSINNHALSNSLPRIDRRERRERVDAAQAAQAARLSDVERKRQYRVALNFFNKNPPRGVQLLTQWGFVDDTPESLAKLMFGRRGLSKQMIGEYLGQYGNNGFHTFVLDCFMSYIDVRGLEVDAALRKVLSYFRLPGEAQKIERIMQAFSTHYTRVNPARTANFTGGADAVFILAFAVIMLNTDAHTKSLRQNQRMSKADFIKNLKGTGCEMDKDMLSGIYDRIRGEEFLPAEDHVAQVQRVETDIIGKDKPRLSECHRRLVCYCRLHSIADLSKKQGETAHERDVFLFNDMLIVTKSLPKKKSRSGYQYVLKSSSHLLKARVQLFSNAHYAFGIDIDCRDSGGHQYLLAAKNYDDRLRFVNDVHEAILECMQMEAVRLDSEYGKQHNGKGSGLMKSSSSAVTPLPVAVPKVDSPGSEGSSRSESQRDSGCPDGVSDEVDPNSSSSGDSSSGHSSASIANVDKSMTPPGQATLSASRTFSRRLSFNSLDSGMVEEAFDAAAL